MDKVLSIIVPTYNMEKYLDRCLSSLIVPDRQMAMLEVLVINDGSTDSSSYIAHGFESRYPNTFRVIDKENGHYGSCVNRGLSESVGKFVKVLDADDWFDTVNFGAFIDFLADNDCDLIVSESITLGEKDVVSGVWKYAMKPSTKYSVSDLPLFSDGNLEHQILTYRRSLLQTITYSQTEGIAYTDLEWICLPMAAVSSFMYFPNLVYIYLQSREGQSVSPEIHCRDIWMEQSVILKLLRLYEKQKNDMSDGNRDIVQLILLSDVKRIYYHYLLDYPKELPNEGLIGFDDDIRRVSLEMYDALADECAVRKVMNIRYIEEWRKKKTRRTVKFCYLDFTKIIGCVIRRFIVDYLRKK